jgi:DNA-binding XRE family transcriptional regulator
MKKSKTKQNRYISQSDAARLIGVTRQSIAGMRKKSDYEFFVNRGTKGKPKWMVDTQSPDWQTYLTDRNDRDGGGSSEGGSSTVVVDKSHQGEAGGKKKADETVRHGAGGGEHTLTAGVDPTIKTHG